jgi:hypothetical protein
MKHKWIVKLEPKQPQLKYLVAGRGIKFVGAGAHKNGRVAVIAKNKDAAAAGEEPNAF